MTHIGCHDDVHAEGACWSLRPDRAVPTTPEARAYLSLCPIVHCPPPFTECFLPPVSSVSTSPIFFLAAAIARSHRPPSSLSDWSRSNPYHWSCSSNLSPRQRINGALPHRAAPPCVVSSLVSRCITSSHHPFCCGVSLTPPPSCRTASKACPTAAQPFCHRNNIANSEPRSLTPSLSSVVGQNSRPCHEHVQYLVEPQGKDLIIIGFPECHCSPRQASVTCANLHPRAMLARSAAP
jgi:hypothetical protein